MDEKERARLSWIDPGSPTCNVKQLASTVSNVSHIYRKIITNLVVNNTAAVVTDDLSVEGILLLP